MASPIGGDYIAKAVVQKIPLDISANNEKLIGYDDFGSAKLILSGNITEMVVMTRDSFEPKIQKLNADEYMVLDSGQIKQYQHSESRLDNLKNIRQTISELRRIINANITDPAECRWVTLTYAENMTDRERLMKDFQRFWQRFLRWCGRNNIEAPKYISVVEPQARGAWHCHLFMIWQQKAPFIPNDVISQLWGNGFTKTKALNDVDNIGAYFSAYLADIPVDELETMSEETKSYIMRCCDIEEKSFESDDGTIKDKRFVKGARLYLYPPGMKLYRCSQDIEKPTVMNLPYERYADIVTTYQGKKKKASFGELTFSSTSIVKSDDRVLNHIDRFYFNTNSKLNGEYEK